MRCIKKLCHVRLKPMPKNKNKTKPHHQLLQFLEYNVAGIAFFWSGYISLLALDHFGLQLWASSSISYTIGLTVNFLLERYWVFKENQSASVLMVATERYLVLSVVNLGLNYVALLGLTSLGIPIGLAPFLAAGLFTPWNWFWYKYWVFAQGHHAIRCAHKKDCLTRRQQRRA